MLIQQHRLSFAPSSQIVVIAIREAASLALDGAHSLHCASVHLHVAGQIAIALWIMKAAAAFHSEDVDLVAATDDSAQGLQALFDLSLLLKLELGLASVERARLAAIGELLAAAAPTASMPWRSDGHRRGQHCAVRIGRAQVVITVQKACRGNVALAQQRPELLGGEVLPIIAASISTRRWDLATRTLGLRASARMALGKRFEITPLVACGYVDT